MRLFKPTCILATFLVQWSSVLADDIVTNVMSPIVSYQYFEWPGDDVLQLQHSPQVSYFFQPGNWAGPVMLFGQVREVGGSAILGATVTVSVALSKIAQEVTDSGGNYQFPAMDGGVYVLTASQPTHANSTRLLTLNPSTARQDFQLSLLPNAPATQTTTRQPSANYTAPPAGPMGSRLLIYDGVNFTNITANNTPATDRMTIVLTHGWIKTDSPDPAVMEKPFDHWPTNMAALIRAAGITPAIANILAWDWRCAAQDPGWFFGYEPSFATDRTHDQGVALGRALQDASALGPTYSQNLHFVGHSLGTLVNAAAVDYLHGYRAGYETPSPTPWTNSGTHMTLLDQAQVAEVAGLAVLETITFMNAAGVNNSQPPLPHDFTWADNYQSLVGFNLSGAVNIFLQKAPPINLQAAHGYAVDWYKMSIASPTDANNPLGFAQSFEWDAANHSTACYFPPLGISQGSAYHQSPWSQDDLALEPMSGVQSTLGLGWDKLDQYSVDGVIQVQNATVQIGDAARSAGQTIGQGFNFLVNQAMQGAQNVVNLWNDSSVLRLSLTTGLLPQSQQAHQVGSMQVLGVSSPTSTTAMAWLPIRIPTNDIAMAFDFIVSGDPVDDVIVCGIADTNLFSLPAKYTPTNTFSTSRLLDVSQWSGQQVELFFGLMGATSSNATLDVENIRFYTLQPPELGIAATGSVVSLTWPLSAGGAMIETTTTLLTPIWETVSNAPSLTLDHYCMTNSWPDAVRFFRLRQSF